MGAVQRLMQFTLDLFDAEPAPLPLKPVLSQDSEQKQALAPVEWTKFATNLESTAVHVPGAALADVVAPAAFHHPRANRTARLCDATVAYELRRGKRRTIGFAVGPDGLVVSAPRWVSLGAVEAALQEKSAWVVRKLGEAQQRQHRLESARIEWKDGAVVPFLGEPVIVVLDPRHAFDGAGGQLARRAVAATLNAGAEALPGVPHLSLHVGLAHHAGPAQIRDAVQAWLMRQARRVFVERLDHFAPHLGVQWKKLSLSNAGTRWGSASADGSIRLNWRLIHLRQPVIDYVVAHELSHLRVMDHSPQFWDTVRTVVPDYATLRGQLRDEALPRW